MSYPAVGVQHFIANTIAASSICLGKFFKVRLIYLYLAMLYLYKVFACLICKEKLKFNLFIIEIYKNES